MARAIVWFSILVLTLAAACGKQEAAPTTAAPIAPPALTPSALAQTDAAAEPAEILRSEVAVDEPLPPFEDDSGILLISRSPLRAHDTAAIRGDVLLYEAPDGSALLRLENFESPKELRLDLALGRDAGSTAWAVGALKGPSGNMNYLLHNGLDLTQVRAFVLIEHGSGAVIASAPFTKP